MSIAELFMERFAGLERAHGVHVPDTTDKPGKKKGKSWTEPSPVTLKLWEDHLKGKQGLGVSPIRMDSTVLWGCLDIDDYTLDIPHFEMQCQEMGFPGIICRTKSGGIHAYLFLSEPAPAVLMRLTLKKFATALNQPKAEIFPKQEQISSEADYGNWLNMPYFGWPTTRYALKDGLAISPEDFLTYAEERALTAHELSLLKPFVPDGVEEFLDAPPCIERLVREGFPQGSMNNGLFSLGVFARKKFGEGKWQDKVWEYNDRYMGPGTPKEVANIIRSLDKKTYAYLCEQQPLCDYCDKRECYTREHGIKARGRAAKKESNPCILDEVDRPVTAYIPPGNSSNEPHWSFTIGGKTMEVTLDMLLDQKKFMKEFTRLFHRLLLQVSEPRWVEALNELLSSADTKDLPCDAGPEGQFLMHLESFCTGRFKAADKGEILLGRPWTGMMHPAHGDDRTWFSSKALMKHLDVNHFRKFDEKQIWAVLRRHGAIHYSTTYKGKTLNVWGIIPFPEQTEDFDCVEIPPEETMIPAAEWEEQFTGSPEKPF